MTPEYGYAMFGRFLYAYVGALFVAAAMHMVCVLVRVWFREYPGPIYGQVLVVSGVVGAHSALGMTAVAVYFGHWPITGISSFFLFGGIFLVIYGLYAWRVVRESDRQ